MCSTSLWVRLAHCSGVLLWKSGCAPLCQTLAKTHTSGLAPASTPVGRATLRSSVNKGVSGGAGRGVGTMTHPDRILSLCEEHGHYNC
jgi:hypothetical protein